MVAVTILIIVYFIYTTRPLSVEDQGDKTGLERAGETAETVPEPVDLAELESDYIKEAKTIVNEFEEITGLNMVPETDSLGPVADENVIPGADREIVPARISQLRNRLMDITVPAQFRDLHLNLVLAFSRMENYFVEESGSDREESIKLITQAKLKNDWLN